MVKNDFPLYNEHDIQCSHGEMDITPGFEPDVGGSSPSGSIATKRANCLAREREEKDPDDHRGTRDRRARVPLGA